MCCIRKWTLPILLLLLLPILLLPVAVYATTYTSYENYTTGDDASDELYAANWFAQTFTTNATLPGTSHTVNIIRLKMLQEGTAGTLTVAIREVNATGYPTGTDLSSGTFDGDTMGIGADGEWFDITITELTLDVNTTYAIVCRGTGADTTNNIKWRYDTGGATYSGGYSCTSNTGGATWTRDTAEDAMFMIFGTPSMEIYGANVFESYVYTGDWLITTEYKNIFEPYKTNGTSSDAFYLQFAKADGTLIAQTPLQAWGYKPGSLYISNATAATLEWGSNYTVKMYGVDSPYYNETYTLLTGDWRGGDLNLLDGWCLTTAGAMEDYYSDTYVVATAVKGEVLDEDGGVMFVIGVPYLDQIRPGLFQVAITSPEYTETDWAAGYEGGLPSWPAAVGPELALLFNDTGDIFSLDGNVVGGILIFIIYAAIASVALAKGHGMAGIGLALPIIFIGFYFRLIPMAVLGVATAVTAVFLIWHLWWRST